MKRCRTCGEEKPTSEFNHDHDCRDGFSTSCRTCDRQRAQSYRDANREKLAEKQAIRSRRWYSEHRDEAILRSRQWYQTNKEHALVRNRSYREQNAEWYRKYMAEYHNRKYYLDIDASRAKSREQARRLREDSNYRRRSNESHRAWRDRNRARVNEQARLKNKTPARREYAREYMKRIRSNNPEKLLRHRLEARLRKILHGTRKHDHLFILVGCTATELRDHIESQFLPGMNWGNAGKWHIDHKRPCASFDLTDPEQQRACFNYRNLQPLWAVDNMSKGAKWEGLQKSCA